MYKDLQLLVSVDILHLNNRLLSILPTTVDHLTFPYIRFNLSHVFPLTLPTGILLQSLCHHGQIQASGTSVSGICSLVWASRAEGPSSALCEIYDSQIA